jgi:hypothetical protein
MDHLAVVTEITRALMQVEHDRWQLNGLHGGRLWIIADSRRPRLAPGTRCTRVTTLARRCLRDRKVVTVTSVWAPDPPTVLRDWELDWPTVVYVPIAARRRLCGVLIVGATTVISYEPELVQYLSDLGEVVAPWVRSFLELRRAA